MKSRTNIRKNGETKCGRGEQVKQNAAGESREFKGQRASGTQARALNNLH